RFDRGYLGIKKPSGPGSVGSPKHARRLAAYSVPLSPDLTKEAVNGEADSFHAQERAAGFQSDSTIREVVEKYAMKKAEEELSNLGFRSFDNTSDKKCYDYTCKRNGTLYYVEVKGTQGAGTSVILTKNEVEHSTQHAQI